MPKIKTIHAREILDSRGNPTLEVEVTLDDSTKGVAAVPSGASTGKLEALELRDGDPKRYDGKGVLKAVDNVNSFLRTKLEGFEITEQRKIDQTMIEADGTENKSKLGANVILGISLACAHAAAKVQKLELYEYIAKLFKLRSSNFLLPTPMMNIFNGGKHADTNLDFQEFMIVPLSPSSFKEKVRVGAEIFHKLAEVLSSEGLDTDVGNEGGYAPDIESTNQAIEMILKAIEKAGYKPGQDVSLAVDAGASTLYKKDEDRYVLSLEKTSLTSEQLIALYNEWIRKYPFIIMEDPLDEEDWEGWKKITEKFGDRVKIVGDDLLVTNVKRLERAVKEKACNSILIKLNQIGTLTETLDCIKKAKKANFETIISHRSGETTDTTIADLAVGTNAGWIKTGAPSRGERVCKYNRLMGIEEKI